jgi:glycosyltransferase involved in cell wall biosynthesis
MKICIVTTEYAHGPAKMGGIATYFERIANWLAGQGHDVSVCIRNGPASTAPPKHNITYYGIYPKQRSTLPVSKWTDDPRVHHLNLLSMAAYDLVQELRDRDQCDAVLGTNNLGISYHISRDNSIPLVTRISSYTPVWRSHNHEPDETWREEQERLEIATLRQARVVIAPSYQVAGMIERLIGRRIIVVRSPMIALDPPSPPGENCSFSNVSGNFVLVPSALEGLKGVDKLAEALHPFMHSRRDVDIIFAFSRVGRCPDGGSMLEYIEKALESHRSRVHFARNLPHSSLFSLMASARFVVVPSVVDNLPNALIEAMHFGRFVVGARGSGIDEVIRHGHNGLLFERNDLGSMLSILTHAYDLSKARARRLERNAKIMADTMFQPDRIGNEIVSLLGFARNHCGTL